MASKIICRYSRLAVRGAIHRMKARDGIYNWVKPAATSGIKRLSPNNGFLKAAVARPISKIPNNPPIMGIDANAPPINANRKAMMVNAGNNRFSTRLKGNIDILFS
jgi:hypothetical protein